MFRIPLLFSCALLYCVNAFAQADFIQLNDNQYNLINRLNIKLDTDSALNYSVIKPFDRRIITERAVYAKKMYDSNKLNLSKADVYNLNLLLANNTGWGDDQRDTSIGLRKIFSKQIFSKPLLLGVKRGNFSAYVFPIINLQGGIDRNAVANQNLYTNSLGIGLRGTLTKYIGFYTYMVGNQEKTPLYEQQYAFAHQAVPGFGYYQHTPSAGFDYFSARGGIMFQATKGIDVQFAYDKVFIGDGYRSLILSDFSAPFLFLKVNARFWKFNYYNLFARLTDTHQVGNDYLYPTKFMTLHHLDFEATKWLHIGVFENILFGRPNNQFDIAYLNPVIFYTAMQRYEGSPDKTIIGGTIKANISKRVQLYSQVVITEWVTKEMLNYGAGFWANKDALQLGVKAIDILGVKNLDIQVEGNWIRPFVYAHNDTVGAFTNYNQPLAHPMGANLRELIVIVNYQPLPKLMLQAKLIYNQQGLDTAGQNFGGNIFRFYDDNRAGNGIHGFYIGNGNLATLTALTCWASYQLIPNLFLEATFQYRTYNTTVPIPDNISKSVIFNLGIRMNIERRQFDF